MNVHLVKCALLDLYFVVDALSYAVMDLDDCLGEKKLQAVLGTIQDLRAFIHEHDPNWDDPVMVPAVWEDRNGEDADEEDANGEEQEPVA
jgi:hypothetical protein